MSVSITTLFELPMALPSLQFNSARTHDSDDPQDISEQIFVVKLWRIGKEMSAVVCFYTIVRMPTGSILCARRFPQRRGKSSGWKVVELNVCAGEQRAHARPGKHSHSMELL